MIPVVSVVKAFGRRALGEFVVFERRVAGTERLADEVRAQIAAEMRLDPGDLAPRRPLVEQGLDSVMTAMVRSRLERRFGRRLPATLLWHQPTIVAIADVLAALLAEPEETAHAPH